MRKEKSPEDLSIDELRQLIAAKKRIARLGHLKRFRHTGRVVSLDSDLEIAPFDHLHSSIQAEEFSGLPLPTRTKAKRVLDGFLLVIEILAVIGLIIIIFSGVQILKNLNSEFSLSLIPATITPTPFLPVVLPSGHTPPNSPGGTRPDPTDIPVHLLPLNQTLAQVPSPAPGSELATQIQIPIIAVDAPIVQGDGWEQLKKGVAQHIGSANPGQSGNMVLSAHNDVYGEIFRDLDQLERGDEIIVSTAQLTYTYLITDIKIVEPTDVEVMVSTTNPILTLISCYPYWVDDQRIVVQASLQSDYK